jgi:adenosylhomocysteine nucleosidase
MLNFKLNKYNKLKEGEIFMKKPILIQAAMEVECQDLLKKLVNKKKKVTNGYIFYEGTINDYDVVITLSKVGLINTSTSLTLAITKYNPIAIINIGIAGATTKKLHLKDIIIGESCININSYRTSNKKENEGSNPNEWELLTFLSGEEDRFTEQLASKDLVELTKSINYKDNIYYGRIGSGDCWNQEIDRILFLNKKYHILCEDMESIATYTIANNFNIPIISLKIISDNSLIGEEYNREVGKDMQEYVLIYIEKLINNL